MVRGCSLFVKVMVALLLILGTAHQAQAVLEAQDGCLVPYAGYGSTIDTAIGIMSWTNTGNVYWSFMSQDGVQLGHGVITLTAYMYSFSLKTEDGNSHPDTTGYVIFTYDDNGTLTPGENRSAISANAVILTENDAAFIPVIPLDRVDYANEDIDLSALTGDSIIGLSYGFAAGAVVSTHFWIDPAFGAQTRIFIWCSQTPSDPFAGHMYSVGGEDAPITLNRDHTVLNMYNLAADGVGVPGDIVDGLLDVGVNGGARFVFSIITSDYFSAAQTMVGFSLP